MSSFEEDNEWDGLDGYCEVLRSLTCAPVLPEDPFNFTEDAFHFTAFPCTLYYPRS